MHFFIYIEVFFKEKFLLTTNIANNTAREKNFHRLTLHDYGSVGAEFIMMGLLPSHHSFKHRDESNLAVELISHNITLARSILRIT